MLVSSSAALGDSATISIRDSRPTASTALSRADFRIRWVILDCASIIDIDDAALKMLAGIPQQLNVSLLMCALKAPVRDLLQQTQFFTASDTAPSSSTTAAPARIEKPFVTVHQAVKHLLKRQMHEELQEVANQQREEEEAKEIGNLSKQNSLASKSLKCTRILSTTDNYEADYRKHERRLLRICDNSKILRLIDLDTLSTRSHPNGRQMKCHSCKADILSPFELSTFTQLRGVGAAALARTLMTAEVKECSPSK